MRMQLVITWQKAGGAVRCGRAHSDGARRCLATSGRGLLASFLAAAAPADVPGSGSWTAAACCRSALATATLPAAASARDDAALMTCAPAPDVLSAPLDSPCLRLRARLPLALLPAAAAGVGVAPLPGCSHSSLLLSPVLLPSLLPATLLLLLPLRFLLRLVRLLPLLLLLLLATAVAVAGAAAVTAASAAALTGVPPMPAAISS
jgi:hypothetical protein